MPVIKKYRVETDKGTFEVEVDESGKPTSNPGTETDDPNKAYWDSIKKTAGTAGSGILKGLKTYLPKMGVTAPPTKDQLEAEVAPVTAPPAPGPSLADNFRDLTDPAKGGEVIGQLIPQLLTSMGSRLPVRSIANTGLNVGAAVAESPITNLAVTPRAASLGKLMRGAATAIGRTPSPEVSPVDRYMPNTGGPQEANFAPSAENVPTAIPTPPADAPRLAGKAPTLEEELLKIVESMRQPEDPRITSLPPEADTTAGGPFKQSGKFGKSGNLGQAGGYTSGNPSRSVEDTIYDNVVDKMGGTGPETPRSYSSGTPSHYDGTLEPMEPLPSHGPTDPQGRPLRPVANQGLEKPRVTFREAIANLRANVGARDAAYAMGGKDAGYTRGTIQELAPGPSRIPNEAEGRIQDFLMKMAMEEDNK